MKCIYFIFLRRSFTLIFSQSDIDLLNNFTDLCVQLFFFLFLTLCLSYGMAWHWLDSLLLNSQFYYIIKRDEEFFMIEIENMCKQFVLRLLLEEENEIQMFNWFGHFVLLAQLGFLVAGDISWNQVVVGIGRQGERCFFVFLGFSSFLSVFFIENYSQPNDFCLEVGTVFV